METSNEKNEILEIVENLKPIFKLVKNNNKFLFYLLSIVFFSWYLNPIIKESRIKNICAFNIARISQTESPSARGIKYEKLANKLGLVNGGYRDVGRFCQFYKSSEESY